MTHLTCAELIYRPSEGPQAGRPNQGEGQEEGEDRQGQGREEGTRTAPPAGVGWRWLALVGAHFLRHAFPSPFVHLLLLCPTHLGSFSEKRINEEAAVFSTRESPPFLAASPARGVSEAFSSTGVAKEAKAEAKAAKKKPKAAPRAPSAYNLFLKVTRTTSSPGPPLPLPCTTTCLSLGHHCPSLPFLQIPLPFPALSCVLALPFLPFLACLQCAVPCLSPLRFCLLHGLVAECNRFPLPFAASRLHRPYANTRGCCPQGRDPDPEGRQRRAGACTLAAHRGACLGAFNERF